MRYALALLLLAGCREGTSVVVRIEQGDVVIPTDVAAVHVSVTNPELSTTATTFDSQVLPLCAAGAAKGCYTLPLSVTLRPGDASPDALVRAEVTALDSQGNEVIHDAAEFHFDKGEHTALDFFLSQACLSSTCATSNQLCGRNGGCVTGTPTQASMPDLAVGTTKAPVTRWAENSSNNPSGVQQTWVLPKPVNVTTGDLIIAAVLDGVPPPKWQVVTGADMDTRLIAYHFVGDGETDADYTFTAPALDIESWLYAAYRGVSAVVVGGISGAPASGIFDFPSTTSPSDGALLTTWIASNTPPTCTVPGATVFFPTDYAVLTEQAIAAGPTGARTVTCDSMASLLYGVQLLLVP